MRYRRDEGGQMLLLAGVIIVLGFLALSLETALLANTGQNTGRELEHPLTTEYVAVRHALETALPDELRDAASVVRCPSDLVSYADRVGTILATLRIHQDNRGHFMRTSGLTVTKPDATTVLVEFRLEMADVETRVVEDVNYRFSCT